MQMFASKSVILKSHHKIIPCIWPGIYSIVRSNMLACEWLDKKNSALSHMTEIAALLKLDLLLMVMQCHGYTFCITTHMRTFKLLAQMNIVLGEKGGIRSVGISNRAYCSNGNLIERNWWWGDHKLLYCCKTMICNHSVESPLKLGH